MISRPLLAICLITQMICGVFAQQPGTSNIGPPPPPQQKPQQPDDDDVVKITTNLVQVDAVVTDKSGKVVTNLKPEDLEISEDGKPQKITHLSYNVTGVAKADQPAKSPDAAKAANRSTPNVPVPLPPLRREDVRRSIAIVIDDLGMSF